MNKLSIPLIVVIFLFVSPCFVLGDDSQDQSEMASVDFTVQLGKRETFMRDGQHGLRYYPDLQLGFIAVKPKIRLFIIANSRTYLLEGSDLWNLRPTKVVLEPQKGNIDNGYCGATSAIYDPKTKGRLLAFIHTEDHENMPMIAYNNVHGFYATVALAESFDDGYTFRKIGPVLTSFKSKNPKGNDCQGCADPSVILDKTKQYYLAYYFDHAGRDTRGCQISVARCNIKDGGIPGKWLKYYESDFKEPGLGGKDTPVINAWNKGDAIDASVVYIKSIDKYVMVYCLIAYKECDWKGAKKSGLYITISEDGVHWSESKQINVGYPVPATGAEFMGRPTLVPVKTTPLGFQGYIMYAYSEKWPSPHYWLGQPISFTMRKSINDTQKKLEKTKANVKKPEKLDNPFLERKLTDNPF